MLSTSEVNSLVFRHLTSRETPALTHPTNRNFNGEDWKNLIDTIGVSNLDNRDVALIRTALLIGYQNEVIRAAYTDDLFVGFTSKQIAILAVTHANRTFLLAREKAREAFDKAVASERPMDLATASQVMIQPADGLASITVDNLNTAVIDTLPHWFALAGSPQEGTRKSGENLGGVAQHAGAVLSLEHAFRDVWQEMLWAPWRIGERSEGGWVMVSENPDWQTNWLIWSLRDQNLHLQNAILNRQLERLLPSGKTTTGLAQTVVGIDFKVEPPILTVGAPSESQVTAHKMAFDALEDTYTQIFSGQEVAGTGVTITLLSRAVLAIQDLVEIALPEQYNPADPDWSEMERLACSLPRETVVEAVTRSLEIEDELAASCIEFLTSDPATQLSEMFRIGVWHRPLIATPDHTNLLVVAGALVWGSAIRRTERWLQTKNGDDLSKTPNGLLHEAHVRATIADALSRNTIIDKVDCATNHLPKGRAEEEVDLVVRIGNIVLVCEVKCFLTPGEANENYNYVRKLEKASRQARRKATWLERNQTLAHSLVGGSGQLTMLPLIIVNQSAGIGLVFGDCQVTDVHFLKIVLAGGKYNYASKFEGNTSPVFFDVSLYSSLAEAEAVLPKMFTNNLGLRRYHEAIRFTKRQIPLTDDEGQLTMPCPVIDEEAYRASYLIVPENDKHDNAQ
ncbi:hypothetical protein JK164_10900 [Gluconobacter kondonii]|uniref:hypothetical protein n=1 Tax=Gluconobacter kondonii TaxID=941463 RepID=UPI001B8CF8A7|nr:hypothetical protein [Gluconobacter kondonii]MBS1066450.1 hypothetical protein [Gluconobacter kondonii]